MKKYTSSLPLPGLAWILTILELKEYMCLISNQWFDLICANSSTEMQCEKNKPIWFPQNNSAKMNSNDREMDEIPKNSKEQSIKLKMRWINTWIQREYE
jgi:hypothetical protein